MKNQGDTYKRVSRAESKIRVLGNYGALKYEPHFKIALLM